MHHVAQRHTQGAGKQANQRKFGGVGPRNGALALPQHPQHGRGVEVLGRKPARGQRHSHGREQRGQQRHQAQEFLGTVEGLAHFRAAAFQRLHAHAMHFGFFGFGHCPLVERLDGRCRADDGKAIRQAAGGLHQARGGQVTFVDHHPRRKAHEARAPVRLDDDDARNAQLCIAQQQLVAHGEVERFEQRRIHPHFAGRRDVARRLLQRARGICHREAAAQRVARLHTFERHQLAGATLRIARAAHGRKAQRGHRLEPERLGALHKSGWRRVVAGHHRIAPQ